MEEEIEDAMLGSIAFILRIAFKELYPEQAAKQPEESDGGDFVEPLESQDLSQISDTNAAKKIHEIQEYLRVKKIDVSRLLDYLKQQIRKSKNLDEEDLDTLKRKGLIYHAHIPVGPSQLTINSSFLKDYGDLGQFLLMAKELLEANYKALLRRSGRIPIAEGLNVCNSQGSSRETLHYLNMTVNLSTREEIILKDSYGPRGQRNSHDDDAAKTTGPLVSTGSVISMAPNPSSLKINEEQLALDNVVATRLKQKLGYLKNPRYSREDRNYHRSLIAKISNDELGFLMPVPAAGNKAHHFICRPWPILFSEYQVGETYITTAYFQNVTAITRSLGLTPPTTQYFNLELLMYPNAEKRDVAPGAVIKCLIRFTPDSLANYEDNMTVHCETGKIHIPILAQRQQPKLNLKDNLDIGVCLVGDVIKKTIAVKNLGGYGRFRFLRSNEFPFPEFAEPFDPIMKIPPFRVSPTEFELNNGETLDLSVVYAASELGKQSIQLLLLCDNCTLREISLNAEATRIGISVCEVNGVAVAYDPLTQDENNRLYFDAVAYGSSATRTFSVQNHTAVELNFTWHWGKKSTAVADYGEQPFSIRPQTGFIPPHDRAQFEVVYQPSKADVESETASFILAYVPLTSVPLPGQNILLEQLFALGSTQHFCLENWVRQRENAELTTISKNEMQLDLLSGLIDGPYKYDIIELLDTLFDEADMLPVRQITEKIPNPIKCALEESLRRLGHVSDRPWPQRNVEALKFQMLGTGENFLVDMIPSSHYDVPGSLIIGQQHILKFSIHNLSKSAAKYFWEEAQTSFISDNRHTLQANQAPCSISVFPSSGYIGPGEKRECQIEFTAFHAGDFSIRIPYASKGIPSNCTPNFSFHARVVPEKIKFLDSEVDFGLISSEGSVSRSLSFVNQSQTALSWGFSSETFDNEAIDDDQMGLCSARSNLSMQSAKDNGIDSMKSSISFEPESGVINPGEITTISVALRGGKLAQRVRGHIICAVKSKEAESKDGGSFFMSYRGEVQQLKVYLDKMVIDLGVCYIGVPVQRTIILKNVSNLLTRFKFDKPFEVSKAYDFTISPETGDLHEKEVLQITLTFTARLTGVIDELYACKIFGMNYPLGIAVKAINKGVVVSYQLLNEAQQLPPPIAERHEAQLPDGIMIPAADSPPTLAFQNVPLFQRKTLRFVIRNFSAVSARFWIQPHKYPASKGWAQTLLHPQSTCSGSGNRVSRDKQEQSCRGTKDTLSGAHEHFDKFRSHDGKKYVAAKDTAEEDRQILCDAGIAFIAVPSEGVLTPWGVTEVLVTAYNNMSGAYSDELQCVVEGMPTANLSININVEGCPLSLRKECVGLDMTTFSPTLRFGKVCSGDTAKTKHVRVKNSGPVDCLLTSKILAPDSKFDTVPVVALSLSLQDKKDAKSDPNRLVRLQLLPMDDSKAGIFVVRPKKLVIRGFSQETISIVAHTRAESGFFANRLVADAQWLYGQSSKSRRGTANVGAREERMLSAIRVLTEIQTINPELFIDKRKHSEKNEEQYLKFEVPTTCLKRLDKFGRKLLPSTADFDSSMSRTISLTNPLPMSVEFNLEATPPFVSLPSSGSSKLTAYKGRKLFILRPQETIRVDLLFLPTLKLVNEIKKKSETPGAQSSINGKLEIQFKTGQIQTLHLRGIILQPMIVVSPEEYDYGHVKVEEASCIDMHISNPTVVSASWRLVHVHSMPRSSKSSTQSSQGRPEPTPVDDPSVFEFLEQEGNLKGPSMPLRSSLACIPEDENRSCDAVFKPFPVKVSWKGKLTASEVARKMNDDAEQRVPRTITVKFCPKDAASYRSRFRFLMENGEGFDVLLCGKGTHCEHLNHSKLPKI